MMFDILFAGLSSLSQEEIDNAVRMKEYAICKQEQAAVLYKTDLEYRKSIDAFKRRLMGLEEDK